MTEIVSPKARNGKSGAFTTINSKGEWLWLFRRLVNTIDHGPILHRFGSIKLGAKDTKYEKTMAKEFRTNMLTELHVPSSLTPNGEQTLKTAACGIFKRMSGLHAALKASDGTLFGLAKNNVFFGNSFDVPLVYGLKNLGLVKASKEELEKFWLAIRRYAEILNGMPGDRHSVLCRADTTTLGLSNDCLHDVNKLLIDMGLVVASDAGGRLAAVENVKTLRKLKDYISADGFKETLIIGGPGTGKSYEEITSGRIHGVISLANKIAKEIGEKARCPSGSYAMFSLFGGIRQHGLTLPPTHVDEIGAFSLREWATLLNARANDLLGQSETKPLVLMGDDLQQVSFTGRGLLLHSIIRELDLRYPKKPCMRIHGGLPQTEDLRALYQDLMEARTGNNPSLMKEVFAKPRRGVHSNVSAARLIAKPELMESGEVLVLSATNKQCDDFTRAVLSAKGVFLEYDGICSFAFLNAPEGTVLLAECTENDSEEGVYNRMRATATRRHGYWAFSCNCQNPEYFRPRYATTVFSSQGLSANHVALLPPSYGSIGIEVLFTAATRHRESFSFVDGGCPQNITPAVEINNFDELRKIEQWKSVLNQL